MVEENKKERRMYVKIRFYKNRRYSTLAEVYYFRNEMSIDFFMRWKWYFEYRAALLRVQNPHAFIELTHGSYEFTLPDEEYRIKTYNLLLGAKRKKTEFQNKIDYAKKNWNELFPIEDHPLWKKVEEKLNYYIKRVELLSKEYEVLNDEEIKAKSPF